MNCALWLNRRKVFSAEEIPDNLDVASLRGYFTAGSLLCWLREHGGENYADKLEKISPDSPELNEKIAEIFSRSPKDCDPCGTEKGKSAAPQGKSVPFIELKGTIKPGVRRNPGSFFSSGRVTSLSGSYRFTGGYGSGGSGISRRFWEWEWEWETSSGSSGSFGSYLKQLRLRRADSFTFGSYGSFGGQGSFRYWEQLLDSEEEPEEDVLAGLDEYDRIMYHCLKFCPLDRFGYGIHNI